MGSIFSVVALGLLSLSLVVVVHEFGHFWVARFCGVTVRRFSVGFGKPFFSIRDRHGTEFSLAPIPLGGYVSMVGENPAEEDSADLAPGSFAAKSVPQRAAIAAAGPLINILFTILIYWGLFMAGTPVIPPVVGGVYADSPAAAAGMMPEQRIVAVDGRDIESWQDLRLRLLLKAGENDMLRLSVLDSAAAEPYTVEISLQEQLKDLQPEEDPLTLLGLAPRVEILPKIGEVLPDSPAEQSGLQAGDLILRVEDHRVLSWGDLTQMIRARPETEISLLVQRDGMERTLRLRPQAVLENGTSIGRAGITLARDAIDSLAVEWRHQSPLPALGSALERSWDVTVFTAMAIGKLISGALSPDHLSGPVTIVKIAGETAESGGLRRWLELMALISLNLGIINLLPIPLLDGGHLAQLGLEGVRGKPLSPKMQSLGMLFGAFLLGCLMIFAIYNDLARL